MAVRPVRSASCSIFCQATREVRHGSRRAGAAFLLAPVAIALPDLLCRHTGLIEPPTRRDTVNIHKHPTAVDDIFGGALPHNIEAEQCLIGAIFINKDAFAAIKGLVTAEDFFEP